MISDIFETVFGYHIIRVTEIKPAQVKPLPEVRAEIERDLRTQQAQKRFAEAEPLLIQSYERLAKPDTAASAHVQHRKEAGGRIIQLYESWGKSDQAVEWKKKLEDFEKQAGSQKGANTGAKKQ